MPRTCTICQHGKREKIDGDLVACVPLRRIAAQYATSTGALQRHRCHISNAVINAAETCDHERGTGRSSHSWFAFLQRTRNAHETILNRRAPKRSTVKNASDYADLIRFSPRIFTQYSEAKRKAN